MAIARCPVTPKCGVGTYSTLWCKKMVESIWGWHIQEEETHASNGECLVVVINSSRAMALELLLLLRFALVPILSSLS
jgi:hypothetical protein